MERRKLGIYGENLAVRFLEDLKYNVLCANYRCKLGEIDIVAMDKNILVFVEVKTRSSDSFGRGMESVNLKKQKRIRRVAVDYLSQNDIPFLGIRFDVIDIIVKMSLPAQIEHIKNAF